jgi:hypothetical protein
MKLQFNLLPNVKQEYLKTKRTKRTVITAAMAASSVALFILLLMITTVYIVNKKQLSDANKDIDTYTKQLKAIPSLDKILTVQNQLKSVASLHQSKHITSRISDYLPQVTPTTACLGKVTIDLVNNTMVMEGTADSLKTINTYIDTLKFTTYALSGQDTKQKAFPSVVESQFGISASLGNNKNVCGGKPAIASYQLAVQYDPALFAGSQTVKLNVPAGLSTTRSVIDDPSNVLFNGDTGTNATQGSQGAKP